MEYETVIYEKEGHIARITLNSPHNLNAFPFPGQGGLNDDFHAALDEAEDDDDIKVVVIKGAGRAFSAGHDLTKVGYVYGMTDQGKRPNQRVRYKVDRKNFGECFQRMFLFPKITIAQVHGYCYAEGLIYVECCDLAIAAEDTKFAHTEARLGGAAGVGLLPILFMTIGMKNANKLMFTGETIDGKEAERIGLVNSAVPIDQLEDEVNKLADIISRLPRDGIAVGKAARTLAFDSLGISSGFNFSWIFHAAGTNIHWEPDEYNFFKARRDKGITDAIHKRDEYYTSGESKLLG